jgi:hypothetical protein
MRAILRAVRMISSNHGPTRAEKYNAFKALIYLIFILKIANDCRIVTV